VKRTIEDFIGKTPLARLQRLPGEALELGLHRLERLARREHLERPRLSKDRSRKREAATGPAC